MNPNKLIILDRDGTINEDRYDYVKSADEWVPIPGSLEAIAQLNQDGWRTVIATNQSGLGRGLYDMASLNATHIKMNSMLAKVGGRVDAVFFCPHTPDDNCECRKPLPGLFLQIGERFGYDLNNVQTVGDSLRDMQAGAAAGCKTHFVRSGKDRDLSDDQIQQVVPGTHIHANLAAFADFIVLQHRYVLGSTGKLEPSFGGAD